LKTRAVVFGGISGKHLSRKRLEPSSKAKPLNKELGEQRSPFASPNAATLKYNATKIDMAKGLLASWPRKVTRKSACKRLNALLHGAVSGALRNSHPPLSRNRPSAVFGRKRKTSSSASRIIGITEFKSTP